ncbi:MAG TPA: carboxypeptidase regulatory-like domain-containing protein [Bryobacteraceae bacterium]|nr:carboxypeptidase regulatory-like domain-containing protein [Bryobacteraceae bacterium]
MTNNPAPELCHPCVRLAARALLFGLLISPRFVAGQTAAQTGTLRGVITDSSGASVPKAKVTLTSADGAAKTSDADGAGAYRFLGVAPGDYTIMASAPQLVLPEPVKLAITGGIQVMNLQLKVEAVVQTVSVEDTEAPTVTTDANNNASAVVLRGDDLEAIADNPEDMLTDLQALAGPSAGPSGGSVYVDGFSNGELPAKESIREIRINQNPFSPEYDKLGLGRIEILTKPGADRFRGTLNFNYATDAWNSRNPYSAEKAPLLLQEFENTISGPLGKRTSFVLDANQNNVDNGSIINAVALDPQTLAASPLFQNFKTVQKRTRLYPRIDHQLTPNNTLTFRYSFTKGDIDGAGIGGFDLISRGYRTRYTTHTAQILETIVVGSAINETRFQFYRNGSQMLATSLDPEIRVLGSFNSGGAQIGRTYDAHDDFELHNNTSILHGAHFWKFGVRMRDASDDNTSPSNFNGTFTFSGGPAPELDSNNQPVLDPTGQPVIVQIGSIEQYRRTLLLQSSGLSPSQIRALGGGATQFSIGAGNPEASVGQVDVGAFVGDDWRVRPNLTLSYGLRYEIQTNIGDHRDFAPRIGLAWAPGANARTAKAKLVLRAGFGIFYDRFGYNNVLTARRYNGIVQQQYVIDAPDFFPTLPSIASLANFSSAPVIQTIAPGLRAPALMQSVFSAERQLPFGTTLAVTYSNSHGLHLLRSQDVNAPIEGTFSPGDPGSARYPLGHPGAVLQMESTGRYNQNQMIFNVTSKINSGVSLTGSYVLNWAMSDTDGVGTFPASPYSMTGEYGPAATDVRQRVSLTANLNTKWNVRFSPFVTLLSGVPFDITTGNDLYGTTLLNSRPGIATDPSRPGLIQTPYGLLDPSPIPGEQILGRNFGRGPGQVNVNFRVSKTIPLGPTREGTSRTAPTSAPGLRGIFSSPAAPRRYNLSISMSYRNILNHTNPGPIIGDITTPLFGRANQMFGNLNGEGFSENANNRRGELQIRFTF